MSSFWMPKKQPLYAPMIASFGGGSARGYGRGRGAGGVLYNFTSFTFYGMNNNAQLLGYLGPTYSGLMGSTVYQQAEFYNKTDLFNVTSTGIQVWTVPETATYEIQAISPRGQLSQSTVGGGGAGVLITGDVNLTQGEKIYILVGQPPTTTYDGNSSVAGSGGTFVVKVPSSYVNSIDSGVANCTLSDVIMVAGAGSRYHAGHLPGNHPAGADTESYSARRYGRGRGAGDNDWAGPSGGGGFYLPAHETPNSVDGPPTTYWTSPLGSYTSYSHSSYPLYAASFIYGGRGGKGANSGPTLQTDNGMYGSGGFGGGGGQFTGNSYSCGSGGMIGGSERNDATGTSYPGYTYAGTGNQHTGSGGSYVNSSIVSNVTSSNVNQNYGRVVITKF